MANAIKPLIESLYSVKESISSYREEEDVTEIAQAIDDMIEDGITQGEIVDYLQSRFGLSYSDASRAYDNLAFSTMKESEEDDEEDLEDDSYIDDTELDLNESTEELGQRSEEELSSEKEESYIKRKLGFPPPEKM